MADLRRLAELKERGQHIVMVTAYDYPSARVVETAGVDVVLVGDSAATTVLGYQTTREVSLDEMLMLTRAVRRGLTTTPLIGDLPFGTYEESDERAVETARAFMDSGCDGVKLEGADARLERVRTLVEAGIPVMGHVGLEPQTVASPDGFRVRGRAADAAMKIITDAQELERAGCFALVVEAVPMVVADALTRRVALPVIGIGASANTDGQVLVYHDLLGLIDAKRPKFVKEYVALAGPMVAAIRRFAQDVRRGDFPAPEHGYAMPDAERVRFAELLGEQSSG
ncbi:MAG TPA: 3-methyl-2-oxobutanoate hydroxymethyltransferase [Gemmatimonadaceae bacterium]|jgi:3-methyl-2-oxobutanoate hydroxymethyltransferase